MNSLYSFSDQLEVYKKKQDFFQSRIVKEIKFIFVVLRVNDKQVSIWTTTWK